LLLIKTAVLLMSIISIRDGWSGITETRDAGCEINTIFGYLPEDMP